jgi:hypothetical protein
VQFGAIAGTLIVDPGAIFNGNVTANSAVDDKLVLAGTSTATLTGLGTTVTGFTTIVEDGGAHWTLDGSLSGPGGLHIGGTGATLTLTGACDFATIAFATSGNASLILADATEVTSVFYGFGTADVIDLQTIQAASLDYANHTLTVFDASHAILDTLTFAGSYTAADFALQGDGGTGTDILYAGADALGSHSHEHAWGMLALVHDR